MNEAATSVGSPGELLSRRCVALLKTALRPDVWPNAELKLLWFDKLLMTVESHSPNFANICTALELLSFLLGILVSVGTYVTVFRPYRREAVPPTTTHLPVGLALSLVVVDNQTWPSVPLGPCPGCHRFSHQNAHMHHQVSLVLMTHPPHANSRLNFHIKADPHLDLCLFWVDVNLDRTS